MSPCSQVFTNSSKGFSNSGSSGSESLATDGFDFGLSALKPLGAVVKDMSLLNAAFLIADLAKSCFLSVTGGPQRA